MRLRMAVFFLIAGSVGLVGCTGPGRGWMSAPTRPRPSMPVATGMAMTPCVWLCQRFLARPMSRRHRPTNTAAPPTTVRRPMWVGDMPAGRWWPRRGLASARVAEKRGGAPAYAAMAAGAAERGAVSPAGPAESGYLSATGAGERGEYQQQVQQNQALVQQNAARYQQQVQQNRAIYQRQLLEAQQRKALGQQ